MTDQIKMAEAEVESLTNELQPILDSYDPMIVHSVLTGALVMRWAAARGCNDVKSAVEIIHQLSGTLLDAADG